MSSSTSSDAEKTAGAETTPNTEKTATSTVAQKSSGPPPPPNGGLQAWCQVVGSFFLFFNGWGLVSSFGVFQTYYELNHLSNKSPSDIAWIGSLQTFFMLFGGALSGPVYDWGYFKALILVGSFLQVFGMFMTSICKEYWQTVLAQGLVVGIGMGCVFVPSVAILPSYFSTRRGLANGLAASGSGLGGVIYPVIFQKLQPQIGFGWATRVIAFIMLGTAMIPLFLMKMRMKPPGVRKLFEAKAWTEAPYSLWAVGSTIGMMGLFTPLFYVESFAIGTGIMSVQKAWSLIPILNTGSIIGRIVPNFLVDRTGPLNMLIFSSSLCSILCYAWIGVHNIGGVVVFSLLFGFASGLYLTLPAVSAISLSPNMGVVGTRMGMAFTFGSVGLLIGQPIAGAIVKHGWVGVQAYAGTCLIVGTLGAVAARIAKAGPGLRVKA